MLEIAGGILLAVLIIVFLPYILYAMSAALLVLAGIVAVVAIVLLFQSATFTMPDVNLYALLAYSAAVVVIWVIYRLSPPLKR